MDPQTFERRATTLEDKFFHELDQKLCARLQEQWNREQELKALREETGITEQSVLERLLDIGIHPGMIRAILLVPAVSVAWANGFVDMRERAALLQAAEEAGISAESESAQLLGLWLKTKPGPGLFAAWQHYVAALRHTVDSATYHTLQESATALAERIAVTAGGILGLGAISADERRVISQVADTFTQKPNED